MQKLELYLNIVHFCYYRADYKLHLLFNKINPVLLLSQIPFIKRRNEKLDIDIQKRLNDNFRDKNFGYSLIFSGGYLMILLFLFVFGVFGLTRKLFTAERLEGIHFVFFVVVSASISYIFVLKKNKYIPYFNKFERWSKEEKRKYGWFTFAITIAFFYLFTMGF